MSDDEMRKIGMVYNPTSQKWSTGRIHAKLQSVEEEDGRSEEGTYNPQTSASSPGDHSGEALAGNTSG